MEINWLVSSLEKDTQKVRLSEEFLAPYRKKDNPFKTLLAKSTYLTKYSRDGETWTDTIRRVVESNINLAPEHARSVKEAKQLFHLFWTGQSLPAGRSLWTGGIEGIPADARYNCFAKETLFFADGDVVSFEEVAGKTVQVRSKDKQQRPAEVKSFGVQKLFKFTLTTQHHSSKYEHVIYATEDHRWFTLNRGEVTDLQEGDRLLAEPYPKEFAREDKKAYANGYAQGFVYAMQEVEWLLNGSVVTRHQGQALDAMRDILKDSDALKEWQEPSTLSTDNVVTFDFGPVDPKENPEEGMPLSYKAGFFDALIFIQEYTAKKPLYFDCVKEDLVDWVQKYSALLGYVIQSKLEVNGKTQFVFKTEAVQYRVISKEETDREETVYCVVEPETHSFSLYDGVYTGNCWYTTLKSIDDWAWVTNQLMLGGGVGVGLHSIESLPTVSNVPARFAIHCDANHENVDEVAPNDKAFLNGSTPIFYVEDSREGWVDALRTVLKSAYSGEDLIVDVSKVRPRGRPIRTFGGISGGPGPLAELLRSIWDIVQGARGRKLTSVEALDITNHIGLCIKSGNVRRCLPGDTLVHTEKGLVPIRDVSVGDKVLTSGTKGERFMPVTAHMNQGVQRLFVVETQMGSFRCTGNHRVAVLTGVNTYEFRMASELEPGDHLVFVDQNLPGEATKLPAWSYEHPKNSTTCVDITIPDLTDDVAWFLGYLLGDGYVRANYKENGFNAEVSLAVANDSDADGIMERIENVLAKFGVNTSKTPPSERDGSWKVRATSKQLAWYFHENFKQPNTTLQIPSCILQGTPRIRAAFAAGVLDADGARNNKPVVLAASIYPTFLEELQAIYASMGIPTRLKLRRPAKDNWKAVYHLNLVGTEAVSSFQEKVQSFGFRQIRVSKVAQYDYGYPRDMVKQVFTKKDWGRSWTPGSKQMVTHLFKKLGGDTKGLIPIMVNDVYETEDTSDTYDIEVAGAEEFVAAGLLVHNSALIALGGVQDQDFRDAKKDWEAVKSHRHTSNNTIVFKTWNEIKNFDWKSLVEDLAVMGEPGILNLPLVHETDPLAEGVNPCGEQALQNRESCNLAEVFPAFFEEGLDTHLPFKLATRYAMRQRLVPLTDPIANSVAEKNMRIGVSLGGICDFDWKEEQLKAWYQTCRTEADEYAKVLGVNRPITVTTVKPSGTISLLNGSSPGIHAPYAPYYIRRVRVANNDPMADALIDAGVPYETDIYDKTGKTLVFSFPMKAKNTKVTVQNQTLRDQFERQAIVQKLWADNAVSCTLTFSSDEKEQLAELLEEFVPQLKSTSALPKAHGYAQAPYEEITREQYEEMNARINNDHPLIQGGEIDDGGCDNGVCPVR